jgi:hypothetical protein
VDELISLIDPELQLTASDQGFRDYAEVSDRWDKLTEAASSNAAAAATTTDAGDIRTCVRPTVGQLTARLELLDCDAQFFTPSLSAWGSLLFTNRALVPGALPHTTCI